MDVNSKTSEVADLKMYKEQVGSSNEIQTFDDTTTTTNDNNNKNKRNDIYVIITFLLLGIAPLNVWNSALGLNVSLIHNVCQLSGLAVSSIYALFFYVPKMALPCALGGMTIFSIGLQIAHRFFGSSAFDVYYLISFICIGMLSGISQTLSFNVASSMDESMSGYITQGFGLSGIIIFGINLALDAIVPDEKIYDINKHKLLYLYIFSEIILVITCIMSIMYLNLSNKHTNIANIENGMGEDAEGQQEEEKTLSYWEILKDCSKSVFTSFFVNWLTLQLFPGIGHKKWEEKHNISDKNITILVGMFQVFDCVSRYFPTWANVKFLKPFNLSINALIIANLLRLLFVPWFIFNAVTSNSVAANFIQQCICIMALAFTNGWLNTVPFIGYKATLKKVKTPKEIEIVSTFMVLALFLGIFSGTWTTFIYKIFI